MAKKKTPKKTATKKKPVPARKAKKAAPPKRKISQPKKKKKSTPAKKPAAKPGKTAKQKVKVPTKKTSSAKPSPTAKAAAKPVKPTPVAATPAKPVAKPISAKPMAAKPAAEAHAPVRPASTKASAKESLRSRILARAKAIKPVAFSLDEAREIAIKSEAENKAKAPLTSAKTIEAQKKAELLAKAEKPAVPNQVKAASLADILGFNPKKRAATSAIDESESIPEKFRRYYKLLLELRGHLTGQLDQHTEETLKRSSKDDAGDLSSYGQHMADAGTDTFDRDFALSLVSSEQEALSEIEAAIQRIKAGTYGVCEHTGKPIAKERLLAVPFTRFSAEAQKEIERNRYRARQQAGLFGEGEEGGKIADDDSGGDE
jgi:RNA polymerase-binding transcription factor DksA